MNTTFTIQVNITLDASPSLTRLLENLAPQPIGKLLSNDKPATEKPEAEKTATEKPEVEKTAAEEPGAEKTATEEPQPQPEGRLLTTEDIREAMHKARCQIEGEGYLENPKSELVRKYHKPLNNEFIRIANVLGFEKPTKINTQEGIAAFARECENLSVDEQGNIVTNCPF